MMSSVMLTIRKTPSCTVKGFPRTSWRCKAVDQLLTKVLSSFPLGSSQGWSRPLCGPFPLQLHLLSENLLSACSVGSLHVANMQRKRSLMRKYSGVKRIKLFKVRECLEWMQKCPKCVNYYTTIKIVCWIICCLPCFITSKKLVKWSLHLCAHKAQTFVIQPSLSSQHLKSKIVDVSELLLYHDILPRLWVTLHIAGWTYLAGIDDGLELQCREHTAVYDGLGNGESIADVRWRNAGKSVGLHYTVRMWISYSGWWKKRKKKKIC